MAQNKQETKESFQTDKNLTDQHITKDKFLAILAHDLRNPFHIIMNLSEIIQKHIKQGDYKSVSRTAKILHNTTTAAYNLLQNLLEWAVIQNKGIRLNLKMLKIKTLVENEVQALKHICEEKNVHIRNTIHARLLVRADEQMTRTVLRNIISNALKYSYPDGHVVISATTHDGFVILEITDKGMGMSQEEQAQLFKIDLNYSKKGTLSESGTGLGLVLCKEIIQLHGGSIWVKSKPGKGSTLAFSLPQGK